MLKGIFVCLGETFFTNKSPCNKSRNHRYEELSISETRRQILKESQERHGGQRLRERSEITIALPKARSEKHLLSSHGVNSNSEEPAKEDSELQRNSGQNGRPRATTRSMIPIGEEMRAHQEC